MNERLCLIVCDAILREARAVLAASGFDDVGVVAYPAKCHLRSGAEGPPEALVRAAAQRHRQVVVLCGPGLVARGCYADLAHVSVHHGDSCHDRFAPQSLLAAHLQAGAQLVTPGWLATWRSRIEDWGFDQPTAREFFRESVSRLVLLDTGVSARAPEHLREFAGVVDLPWEILPVGLDHFTLVLARIVLESRVAHERRAAGRRLADLLLITDVTRSLADTRNEEAAVRQTFEVLSALCAPGALIYLSMADGRPVALHVSSTSPIDREAATQRLLALAVEHEWTSSERGFRLRFLHLGVPVGALEVDEVAFPEHREQYVDVARSVGSMCVLAIANARAFEAVERAKAELERANVDLAQRNADLDAFAHTVAHDLKTPLTAITGYAGIAAAETTDAEVAGHVERIKRNGLRMAGIIDSLLLFASVRTADVRPVPVEMKAIVDAALSRLAFQIGSRGATVVVPEHWPTVLGYGPWIEEVWANCIDNALKYGGETPRIELGASRPDHGMVTLWVKDDGPGIPAAARAQLFSAFTRASDREVAGHGLGLSIVRRIVTKLGGHVAVESAEGRGSVFGFALPVPPPA
jgi:signal transduction histidine kinase